MKIKYIRIIIIYLVVFSSVLGMGTAGWAARREVRHTYRVRPGAVVTLENVRGDITVTTWDRSEVEIRAVKTGPADVLDEVHIAIDAHPDRVDIRTEYPQRSRFFWWGRWSDVRVSVAYTLQVPRRIHLDNIRTVSGDVSIRGIQGRVSVRSVSGAVTVHEIAGDVDLESVSGGLEVTDVEGDMTVRTVSRDIQIRRVRGSVRLKAVSGDIEVWESRIQRLHAETVSGDISYHGRLNPEGRYELETLSGTVELVLPADAAVELWASTYSGEIETDFEVRVRGRVSPRSLVGTIGRGGPILRIRTFSGDIRIRRVPP